MRGEIRVAILLTRRDEWPIRWTRGGSDWKLVRSRGPFEELNFRLQRRTRLCEQVGRVERAHWHFGIKTASTAVERAGDTADSSCV